MHLGVIGAEVLQDLNKNYQKPYFLAFWSQSGYAVMYVIWKTWRSVKKYSMQTNIIMAAWSQCWSGGHANIAQCAYVSVFSHACIHSLLLTKTNLKLITIILSEYTGHVHFTFLIEFFLPWSATVLVMGLLQTLGSYMFWFVIFCSMVHAPVGQINPCIYTMAYHHKCFLVERNSQYFQIDMCPIHF